MKKKRTLTAFIKSNRSNIDQVIKANGGKARNNDEERRLWVLNDESLYNWAITENVDVDN